MAYSHPSLTLIQISQLTENTRVQMVTALAFQNTAATEIALKNLDEITRLQEEYKASINSAETASILDEFVANWALFDERIRLNEKLMVAGNWEEATKGIQAGKTLFENAQQSFVKLYNQQTVDVNTFIDHNNDVYKNIVLITVVLIIITALIATVIAYTFSRRTARRIEFVRQRAEQIAEGNLANDKINDTGKDEIASLSTSLNNMQDALTKVVGEAADSSQQVSASAEELSATTEESMRAIESIAQLTQVSVESATTQISNLTNMNQSLSQLYTHVQSISESGSEMDQLSRATYAKTQDGAEAIDNVNMQMESIAQSANNTEIAVKQLDAKSQEIGNIVNIITQISEQTNLLALNAAIEAARAGESGKGFAVVADEVRKLAEQSHSSAGQIFTMVQDIQNDIQIVIDSIHEEANRVQEGLQKSKQVNLVFKEIEEMVGDVKQNAREIASAISTIHTINEQIIENTTNVQNLASETLSAARHSNESTETQLSSIEEISAASDSLANLSEQLQTVIGHFKLK